MVNVALWYSLSATYVVHAITSINRRNHYDGRSKNVRDIH
jgi:hypothetical protein